MEAPTRAGVFGITRISFTGLSKAASTFAMDCPAAIETTTASFLSESLISGITSLNTSGFTARNKISAAELTSVFSLQARMPKLSFRRSTDASLLSEAITCSRSDNPEESSPPIIADAILPPPIKPIIFSDILIYTSFSDLKTIYEHRYRLPAVPAGFPP